MHATAVSQQCCRMTSHLKIECGQLHSELFGHRHSTLQSHSLFALAKPFFTMRCIYASAVLGVVILSVRPSVCHMCALWENQTMHCGYFDTTQKGNHFSFLTPTVVGEWCPLPSEICTHNDPPPSKSADFL